MIWRLPDDRIAFIAPLYSEAMRDRMRLKIYAEAKANGYGDRTPQWFEWPDTYWNVLSAVYDYISPVVEGAA